MAPYSMDLRTRVLADCDAGTLTRAPHRLHSFSKGG
jgi:hypothetical protein